MAARDTTPTPSFQAISVKPLHPTFGAEVSGVNFPDPSDEQFGEILAALAKVRCLLPSLSFSPLLVRSHSPTKKKTIHQYGFCVFRNTGLNDTTHVNFSRRFGELDDIGRYLPPGGKPWLPHIELFDVGNVDHTGAMLDPNSPRAHAGKGNGVFHVDSSFNPRRAGFSLLRAVTIPPAETGGDTEFADSRTAWDELPTEIQRELLERDWVGAHCMAQSRKLGSPEFFSNVDPSKAPMARHKIVQRHEQSGRMNLYVGGHMHHLEGEGMTPEKSDEWLKFLNEHTAQKKYVVGVKWEQPGDMMVWDNRAVQHRAGKWTGGGKYLRDMRRTTVHDDGPTAWGVNPVGAPMPDMASFLGKGPAVKNTTQPALVKV